MRMPTLGQLLELTKFMEEDAGGFVLEYIQIDPHPNGVEDQEVESLYLHVGEAHESEYIQEEIDSHGTSKRFESVTLTNNDGSRRIHFVSMPALHAWDRRRQCIMTPEGELEFTVYIESIGDRIHEMFEGRFEKFARIVKQNLRHG